MTTRRPRSRVPRTPFTVTHGVRSMPEQEGTQPMPYAIVHEHPRGTREQYEAAIKVVHPPGGLPEGQIFTPQGHPPMAG
jgi:hypothetical protein